jgi:iron complex transport system ATP-binding protein
MNTLLSARQLNWHIGTIPILKDVSLQLAAGETLGIIGPNGAGKSSLLKLLAGIHDAGSGELRLNDIAYADIEPRAFARQLAYLEQDAQINWPLLTEKVIQLGRSAHQSAYGSFTLNDDEAIDHAIQLTGVQRLLGRPVSRLSQGEKMLVSLARVFASQAGLILADEPVAALDPYHQLLIMELLKTHSQKEGQACIVVLHDLSLAARFCDRLLLLSGGKIVSSGSPAEVLSEENLREFYRILCYSDFSQAIIQPQQRLQDTPGITP